ncbi:hypothetical protein Poli38472_010565 [Pythium oligandrum]|uniref:Ankyrin repeat domain-containing protein n=1 Tax=Pythium oligandrum TaxID=41045 RepID=A0A8K1C3C3_PYTOL|nr:hypothetical protein Poli38472_010565 [Pythium oligandrum]|eukprot:TMW55683.1 hypothetical protein Poli38472_010565 [Pythium oligandrum]
MTQWPEYGKRLELWEAVYKQDLSKVQRLLATPLGIRQVNVPHGMWMQTSVHLAVRKGSSKLLRTMLVAHADVNTRMVNGTTPLHLAVEMKRKDLVQDLLLIGADPMLRNFTNKNAIEMAQDLQLRDIASLLIKAANSLPAQRELKKQQDQAEQLAR